MGWQDRDYAKQAGGHGPVHRVGGFGAVRALGGRSIVTKLIIINAAIFVLGEMFPAFGRLLAGGVFHTPGGLIAISGWAEMRGDLVMSGQIWRLVSAQYLHAGLGHLFINMLVLHFLGRSLENMWSPRKFLAIYTLGGVAGNVFYTVLSSQGVIPSSLPAVGASGCIYALMGIVATLFPQATVYIYFLFPMKIRTAAFIFGGIAIMRVITRGANFGGEACHLAGLVFGVWWAMKGDAWWVRTAWRWPKLGQRRQRPRSTGFKAQVQERRADAQTVDRILKKVYETGIHSLSESEKKALKEATQRQQERESQADRIDRL